MSSADPSTPEPADAALRRRSAAPPAPPLRRLRQAWGTQIAAPLRGAPRYLWEERGYVRLVLKASGAAGLAWSLAALLDSPYPEFAALSAMLTVQVTLVSTLRQGARRVGAVFLGVLLAAGAGQLLPSSGLGIAVLVALALAVGRLTRLGAVGSAQVPSSALLVLAISASEPTYALARIGEVSLGVAVGLVVSLVAVPAVLVQPAADALADWAGAAARVLRLVATELPAGLATAPSWLEAARDLDEQRARAEAVLSQGEDSLRLNPRTRSAAGGAAAARLAQLREWSRGLVHASVQLRGVTRTLADLYQDLPDAGPVTADELGLGAELAALLQATAEVLELAAGIIRSSEEPALTQLAERILAARSLLSEFLELASAPEESSSERAWWVYGPVLADVQRMLRELDFIDGPHAEVDGD